MQLFRKIPSYAEMLVLNTVVDCQQGTFLIIPDVSLRISPNFQDTETPFERCFTKVVALEKAEMRCSYSTLVVKSLKKYFEKNLKVFNCTTFHSVQRIIFTVEKTYA